jgi:hypothetical protein
VSGALGGRTRSQAGCSGRGLRTELLEAVDLEVLEAEDVEQPDVPVVLVGAQRGVVLGRAQEGVEPRHEVVEERQVDRLGERVARVGAAVGAEVRVEPLAGDGHVARGESLAQRRHVHPEHRRHLLQQRAARHRERRADAMLGAAAARLAEAEVAHHEHRGDQSVQPALLRAREAQPAQLAAELAPRLGVVEPRRLRLAPARAVPTLRPARVSQRRQAALIC